MFKFLARKPLSSVVASIVNSPLDEHMCLGWWVVFSLVVFCAACFVFKSRSTNNLP
jgi:hypothetical protein